MSERSFWKSPFKKIIKLIDMYNDDVSARIAAVNQEYYESKYFCDRANDAQEVPLIYSMREVEGFVNV